MCLKASYTLHVFFAWVLGFSGFGVISYCLPWLKKFCNQGKQIKMTSKPQNSLKSQSFQDHKILNIDLGRDLNLGSLGVNLTALPLS